MTDHPKTRQPEALATLAAASRAGGKKPDHVGLDETPDTAPVPTDPDRKDEAATRVLRRGAFGGDQGADEAVSDLPDRTADRSGTAPDTANR